MALPSYSRTMLQPAWLLLDDERNVVASVRAQDPEAARLKFTLAGLSGAWLRKAS